MIFSQVTALSTATSIILASSSSSAFAVNFDCKLSLSNDKFDLTSLSGVHTFDISRQTPPTITKTTYSVSLCSPLPIPSNPSADDFPSGTYVGLKVVNQRSGLDDRLTQVIPIAGSNGDLNPSASIISGQTVEEGWFLHLGGGLYNDVKQVVMIEMVCQAGAKGTAPTLVDFDSEKGLLNLKWITIAACSTTSSTPPPTNPPSSDPDKNPSENVPINDSSWGFFSWFFTLFFLTLIIYFVGGTYYNYSQFGIVEIPHKEVWQDLPYVAADLFKGRGGSRNGYNSLG